MHFSRKALCYILLLFLFIISSTTVFAEQKVLGYYPEWGVYARDFHVANVSADKITHLVYSFVIPTADNNVTINDAWAATDQPYEGDGGGPLRGNFRQIELLKQRHPHLKAVVSLGGYTGSEHFRVASSTPENRQKFAENVVHFLNTYTFFDGVDIDWEFPVIGASFNGQARDEDDEERFTLLLRALRQEMDSSYTLSIAGGAFPDAQNSIAYDEFISDLDWVGVMSYDFRGGWNLETGHQAALYNAHDPAFPEFSGDTAVNNLLSKGVPSEKIVLGVPFYGRTFANVVHENNGLFASFSGLGPGSFEPDLGIIDYRNITAQFLTNGNYVRYFDNEAKAPYLYSDVDNVFITYDDEESIARKASYVKNNSLGGVKIWELSGDDNAALLDAIQLGFSIGGPNANAGFMEAEGIVMNIVESNGVIVSKITFSDTGRGYTCAQLFVQAPGGGSWNMLISVSGSIESVVGGTYLPDGNNIRIGGSGDSMSICMRE